MNEILASPLSAIVRASFCLALAAVVIEIVIRASRLRSASVAQALWLLVLSHGLVFATIGIPVASPEQQVGDPALASIGVPARRSVQAFAGEPRLEERAGETSTDDTRGSTALPAMHRGTPAAVIDKTPPVAWRSAVLLIWGGGIALLALTGAVRYVTFARRAWRARPAPPAWQSPWSDLLAANGVRKHVPLAVDDRIGPVLCRLPRGYRLVVPEPLWDELSPDERRAVLVHELAHLRRGDLWLSFVASLTVLPHWFNPFAWWAYLRFARSTEWACDEAAADAAGKVVYAQALLRLGSAGRFTAALTTSARAGRLFGRIRRVLAEQRGEDRAMKKGVLVGFACCLLLLAALRLEPRAVLGEASDPDEAASPKRDPAAGQHDEKLPDGALARLGTLRLRHAEQVTSVCFSPHGKMLASIGFESVLRLWDTASGREMGRRIVGTNRPVLISVAWSPDGRYIAVVGSGVVELYEPGARQLRWESKEHKGRVSGVAFSPDGTTLATGGEDGTVRLWDVESGAELMLFRTEERPSDAQPVAFSSDGALLASGGRSGTIWIWNLKTGGDPVIIEKAHSRVLSLAFVDDERLVSSGRRLERTDKKTRSGVPIGRVVGEIRVWDAETGELRNESEPAGQCAFTLSGDGRSLVVAHQDAIEIRDFESGEVRRTIDARQRNNSGAFPHEIDLSPDGATLAINGPDNTIGLWNIATGERLLEIPDAHTSNIHAVAVSPDAMTVASADRDGAVYLWDARGGGPRRRLKLGESIVRALEFSPDGETLIAGGDVRSEEIGFHGAVELWSAATGESVRRITFDDRVAAATFSPDGKSLAVSTWDVASLGEDELDSTIHLVDLGTGEIRGRLTGHAGQIHSLTFSPDGRRLGSAAEDRRVRLWDVQARKQITEIDLSEQHRQGLNTAAFAPDLSFAVTAALFEQRITVWDLDSGKARLEVNVPDLRDTVLALSPDRRLVVIGSVSASEDREFGSSIHLLDLQTGRAVLTLAAPDGAAASLAFTPDGKRLISGMARGTALIWDIAEAYENLDAPKGDRQ